MSLEARELDHQACKLYWKIASLAKSNGNTTLSGKPNWQKVRVRVNNERAILLSRSRRCGSEHSDVSEGERVRAALQRIKIAHKADEVDAFAT